MMRRAGDFPGKAFLNMLKMMVLPLIAGSMVPSLQGYLAHKKLRPPLGPP